MMEKETQKSEGPTCACGKADLYEEWLKLQESQKEEVFDSTIFKQSEDENSSADNAGQENQ
ncbi:MAG: hypothetical protein AB9834_21465 [Lentimicrobium sp.]